MHAHMARNQHKFGLLHSHKYNRLSFHSEASI